MHTQTAHRAELSGAAAESERRFFANLMATIKNGGTAAPAAAAGAKVQHRTVEINCCLIDMFFQFVILFSTQKSKPNQR